MKIKDFLQWLDGFLNLEASRNVAQKSSLWLENTRALCDYLGNPQDSYKIIHIAGSKGKGSTAAFAASILKAQGLRTGLYMSPHIMDFRERVTMALDFLQEDIYEEAADAVFKAVNFLQGCANSCDSEKESLIEPNNKDAISTMSHPVITHPFTWFEVVSAFALLCFKIARCDWVVLEVGLGGLLDCTNIVNPAVSVITTIEREHTQFLGNTIKEIATQKAGIIKPHVPCVIGQQRYEDALDVFRKKCKELDSPLYEVATYYNGDEDATRPIDRVSFTCHTLQIAVDTPIKMIGKEQCDNAITTAIATKIALPTLTNDALNAGLSKTTLMARFEMVNIKKSAIDKLRYEGKSIAQKDIVQILPINQKTPSDDLSYSDSDRQLVIDGAHTPFSVKYTVDTLKEVFRGKPFDVLFACAADKDIGGIAKALSSAKNITITKLPSTRYSDPAVILKALGKGLIIEDVKEALFHALSSGNVLLIVGSFYLAAAVRQILDLDVRWSL